MRAEHSQLLPTPCGVDMDRGPRLAGTYVLGRIRSGPVAAAAEFESECQGPCGGCRWSPQGRHRHPRHPVGQLPWLTSRKHVHARGPRATRGRRPAGPSCPLTVPAAPGAGNAGGHQDDGDHQHGDAAGDPSSSRGCRVWCCLRPGGRAGAGHPPRGCPERAANRLFSSGPPLGPRQVAGLRVQFPIPRMGIIGLLCSRVMTSASAGIPAGFRAGQ